MAIIILSVSHPPTAIRVARARVEKERTPAGHHLTIMIYSTIRSIVHTELYQSTNPLARKAHSIRCRFLGYPSLYYVWSQVDTGQVKSVVAVYNSICHLAIERGCRLPKCAVVDTGEKSK